MLVAPDASAPLRAVSATSAYPVSFLRIDEGSPIFSNETKYSLTAELSTVRRLVLSRPGTPMLALSKSKVLSARSRMVVAVAK
jgi:hypothetical protein